MTKPKVQLFEDIWNAIYDDSYMWIVIWGPPRSSKTTLAGHILYYLYKDWDKVLDAFAYNLPQVLYKLKRGIPERWPTKNKLHMRVPALNWDDFGAHSNKAVTQHDEAWDHFKGGFDVLGTKIGVLIATMVDPLEPTFQIQSKYTHEIQILRKGRYKYDEVDWLQDYGGWKPKTRKLHIESNTFDPWPSWVYEKYDEVRMSLADEVIQRIEDTISLNQVDMLLRLCKPIDLQILNTIVQKGALRYKQTHVEEHMYKAMIRLKSRQLVVPTKYGKTYYKYDITPLGLDLLEAVKEQVAMGQMEKQVLQPIQVRQKRKSKTPKNP